MYHFSTLFLMKNTWFFSLVSFEPFWPKWVCTNEFWMKISKKSQGHSDSSYKDLWSPVRKLANYWLDEFWCWRKNELIAHCVWIAFLMTIDIECNALQTIQKIHFFIQAFLNFLVRNFRAGSSIHKVKKIPASSEIQMCTGTYCVGILT